MARLRKPRQSQQKACFLINAKNPTHCCGAISSFFTHRFCGRAPHNDTIHTQADLIEAGGGIILSGGGRLPEKVILTPDGGRRGRRPDIIFVYPGGNPRGRNIGRVDANGNPIPREIEALNDLNGPGGLPTDFVPYYK